MKNLLLITLLFLPFCGSAQWTKKTIDSFIGIKFGSSKAEVESALKTNGAEYLMTAKDSVTLLGGNVKHYDQTAKIAMVSFRDDKAYRASFIFRGVEESQLLETYKAVVNSITKIYGKGKESLNKITDPLKGDEIRRIKIGLYDYTTSWSNNSYTSNTILVNISQNLDITVIYNDYQLSRITK